MSIVQSSPDVGLNSLANENVRAADNGAQQVTKAQREQLAAMQEQEAAAKKVESKTQPVETLSSEQLEKVAQQLQDFVGEMNRGLEFLVDKDSGRDVIKVIDKNSGDLVKQFPSEEVLTLVAKLSEMVGGLVDAKV